MERAGIVPSRVTWLEIPLDLAFERSTRNLPLPIISDAVSLAKEGKAKTEGEEEEQDEDEGEEEEEGAGDLEASHDSSNKRRKRGKDGARKSPKDHVTLGNLSHVVHSRDEMLHFSSKE